MIRPYCKKDSTIRYIETYDLHAAKCRVDRILKCLKITISDCDNLIKIEGVRIPNCCAEDEKEGR